MEIKDLRIGNLHQDALTGTILKVVGIMENGFDSYVIDRSKYPLPDGWRAEPIQLTTGWLEMFGFQKEKTYDASFLYVQDFILDRKGKLFVLRDHNFKNDTIIQYVHQLQNLYYALTGKELGLKQGFIVVEGNVSESEKAEFRDHFNREHTDDIKLDLSEVVEITHTDFFVGKTHITELYNLLLKKYMRHVADCEGVDFVSDINQFPSTVTFSDTETLILKNISNDLETENRESR